MITYYGHDNALFLSLQMKRLGVRSVELLLKKYSSILFGDEKAISARDLRNSFSSTVFSESKNLFVTAALTGNDAYGMRYPYVPYLELFDTEKGKDFDPNKL